MKVIKSGKVNVISQPINYDGNMHYIYYKKHTGKLFKKQEFTTDEVKKEILRFKDDTEEIEDEVEQLTRERTLFVSNLPFDLNEIDLITIFSVFGKVKDVRIGNTLSDDERKIEHLGFSSFNEIKPNSMVKSGTAHILFDDEKGLENSLKKKVKIEYNSPKEKMNGLKKYIEIYKSEQLEVKKDFKKLNLWMKSYDQKVQEEEKMIEIIQNQPDEDGFIKILPKNGKKFQPTKLETAAIRKPKKREFDIPFYKFQRIEKQMSKMEKLRDQFEQDKEKIQRLKNNRKFKP
eukprot:gene1141-10655_t